MVALETDALVHGLRTRGAETTNVEVKAAQGGCPKSIRETLSAFSNLAGGTILLGLTDDTYHPVPIDAFAIRDAVAGMASDDMEPPVRADIEIERLASGEQIVRVDVPELDPIEKPCFVKSKGRYGGSFTRSGDGDRRLTNYEIDRLVENRSQPEFDRETIVHPQQFFPQLCISVVALPRTTMGEAGPGGVRFLDSQTCDGPLPSMVRDAVAAVSRNMTRASIVSGVSRVERPEYPIEVVRELIVNAVLHRDYSPGARGTQVQVELYPDRLVVRSPGGFFGAVDPANFGDPDVSSSRNALLARILADTPLPDGQQMVAENRGSGIPTILSALNAAGMTPPVFMGDFRRVEVTVPRHALLTKEILAWVESLGQENLTQAQVQALAIMRSGGTVRNQTLRGWGVHPADATRDLTDLVRRGLTLKIGDRRGASYKLADLGSPQSDGDGSSVTHGLSDRQEAILHFVRQRKEVTSQEVVDELNIGGYGTVISEMNELIRLGLLRPTAPPRSKNRTYVIPAGG